MVCKLLQVPKQGQSKIQASYVRKYLKTRMSLTVFESFGHGKLEKVMEFEKLQRVLTLAILSQANVNF